MNADSKYINGTLACSRVNVNVEFLCCVGVPGLIRHGYRPFVKMKRLPLLVLIVAVMTVSFAFAIHLTTAIFVQLIHLLVPFIVVFLARWAVNEEIPKFTFLGK